MHAYCFSMLAHSLLEQLPPSNLRRIKKAFTLSVFHFGLHLFLFLCVSTQTLVHQSLLICSLSLSLSPRFFLLLLLDQGFWQIFRLLIFGSPSFTDSSHISIGCIWLLSSKVFSMIVYTLNHTEVCGECVCESIS